MNVPFVSMSDIAMLADQSAAIILSAGEDPKGQTSLLRSLVEAADVFLAIPPDGDLIVVKGAARLDLVAAGTMGSPSLSIGAIRVREPAEGEAMRLVLGDGAEHMRSTSSTRVHIVSTEHP